MQLYAYNFPSFMVFVHFYGSSMWTKFNICDHAMKTYRGTGYYLIKLHIFDRSIG